MPTNFKSIYGVQFLYHRLSSWCQMCPNFFSRPNFQNRWNGLSRFHRYKLTFPQLVNKFLVFLGIQKLKTAFETPHKLWFINTLNICILILWTIG